MRHNVVDLENIQKENQKEKMDATVGIELKPACFYKAICTTNEAIRVAAGSHLNCEFCNSNL